MRYRWRTLQLLPGMERPSYAGAKVEVLERLNGSLLVQYEENTISSQKAPSRPGILRSFNGRSSREFILHPDRNGLSSRLATVLAYSTRSDRPGKLTMLSLTLAHPRSAGLPPLHEGSPRRFRWRYGERCRRRSAGDCRYEGSSGSWVSIGARPRSTWKLRVYLWREPAGSS